eukprot:UN03451
MGNDDSNFDGVMNSMFSTIQMSWLGDFEDQLTELEGGELGVLGALMFTFLMLLIFIVSFNALIAWMTDSYVAVQQKCFCRITVTKSKYYLRIFVVRQCRTYEGN